MSSTTTPKAAPQLLLRRTRPKPTRTWTTVSGAAAALVLLAAGCGDNSDEADTRADEAEADGAETSEAAGDTSVECPVDAAAVSEAVGVEVAEGEFTSGSRAGGSGEANFDGSGAEVTPGDGSYAAAWVGCDFLTDDGSEYLVADLVDEEGEGDLTALEQLVAWAEASSEEGDQPEVGEEALFDGTNLLVREADRTLVLSFSSDAPGGGDDEGDLAGLTDIAAGLLSSGSDELVATCTEGFAAAPTAWGEPSSPLGGSGSGSIGGVEYSYESCSTDYASAGKVNLEIGDAEYFDLLVGDAEADEEDLPQLVPGLGDAAVRMKGELYIQIGDRGVVVAGETPDGEPLGTDPVDALGAAVAETLS